MSLTQQLLNTTKIIVLALVLAFGISYLHAAWVGPTQAPPEGNTPAPINVGSVTQIKDGSLGLFGKLSAFKGYFSSNVGIGDSTPDTGVQGVVLKLDVEGPVGATLYCDQNGNNCVAPPLGGAGLPSCSDGQILVYDGASSSWKCGVIANSTGGGPEEPIDLVNGIHTSDDCAGIGGFASVADAGNYVCQVNGASCPAGWTQYNKWSTGIANYCSGGGDRCDSSCTASGWAWSNTTRKSCSYSSGDPVDVPLVPSSCSNSRSRICLSIVASVGCY